ncbi:MAG TPA: hypothetical protein PKO06_07240 [Candidatus Ozemobacteraceae bacterium]|nr:hypothetical protein [Candidatus Ozemobacteraceae bacterium]
MRLFLYLVFAVILCPSVVSAATASEPIAPPPDQTASSTPATETPSWQPGRHLIRRMSLPHCKRGPMRCAKCKAGEGQIVFSLIDVFPPNRGMVQRPVTEVTIDGTKQYLEYDVVKVFATEAEARAFAAQHQLTDCQWSE